MNFVREHILFIFLLLAAAVLRLVPLFDYQFTFDELSGLDRTQFQSFLQLIEFGVKVDAHPALVQVILFYIVKCSGYVTWIIKLPFILCSLGAIAYGYFTGLRHFGKSAGLYISVILSFSLVFVYYAPIARMYITGVFFSLGLLYYFFEIVFSRDRRMLNYALLGCFALLGALNQHLNALFAFTVFLAALFLEERKHRLKMIITAMVVIAAYLPHLPVTLYQLGLKGIGTEQGGWLEAPGWNSAFKFIQVLSGTGYCWIVVLALVLAGLIIAPGMLRDRKRQLLLLLFVVNYLVIFLYSLFRAPVYQNSVMLFSGVCMVVLIGSLMPSGRFHYVWISLLALSLAFQSYFIKDYFGQSVKTVYEYQFSRTIDYKKMYGEENVYPLFFDADTLMQKIYFRKYMTRFDCKISSDTIISYGNRLHFKRNTKGANDDTLVSSVRLFSEFIASLRCNYVALSSSTPLYQSIVRERFPYLLENTQTQGIHYKLYSRLPGNVVPEDALLYESRLSASGDFTYSLTGASDAAQFPLLVDSIEYPLAASAPYMKVIDREGAFVLAQSRIRYASPAGRGLECCVAVNDDSNTGISYNAKEAEDFVPDSSGVISLYSDSYIGNFHKQAHVPKTLSCYLWNKRSASFEVRDFSIRVIDHWPRKWQFWD